MATYEFPSLAQVAAYARSTASYPSLAPMTTGSPVLYAPRGGQKPRLRLMNNGEIRIKGVDDAAVFFAPLNPLQPVAQYPEAAAVGRPWDYPVGWNTRVTPRSGYAVGFGTLKALADGFDVLRILIERVKDKLVTREWSILPKDEHESVDDRCAELTEFFLSPDRENTWPDWLRMLMEQVIVYDAPALYLRPTRGGALYAVEVMDGALFTPKIMADGRLPPPDMGPAYQQVLHGLQAVDYIKPLPRGTPPPLDPDGIPFPELLYKPRNKRVDSPYGFSPVEQILTTINIALRQETFLLSFYTDGSAPDAAFTTPSTWTTEDIRNFKLWWDSVLAGNLGQRRGTMFLPDGAKIVDFKEGALQDASTAEWLIRLMCFALGLNPMPFVKQMNRGQEQTHHEEAVQEGLEPWLDYIRDLIGAVIRLKFGWDDLELRFTEDDPVDPVDQSKIDASDVQAGIYHPDEIRAKRGDDPMPEEMRTQMAMVAYRNAPNATALPTEIQDEQDARAEAKAQSGFERQKQMAAIQPPAPGTPKPAEKLEVSVLPPVVNVTTPEVKVTLPEIKQGDLFLDVGATNVKVDGNHKPQPGAKRIVAKRNERGEFVGEITYELGKAK